jgi:hypothetical protein
VSGKSFVPDPSVAVEAAAAFQLLCRGVADPGNLYNFSTFLQIISIEALYK